MEEAKVEKMQWERCSLYARAGARRCAGSSVDQNFERVCLAYGTKTSRDSASLRAFCVLEKNISGCCWKLRRPSKSSRRESCAIRKPQGLPASRRVRGHRMIKTLARCETSRLSTAFQVEGGRNNTPASFSTSGHTQVTTIRHTVPVPAALKGWEALNHTFCP